MGNSLSSHSPHTAIQVVLLCLGIWPLFAWAYIVHRLYAWDAVRPFDLCAGTTLLLAGLLALARRRRPGAHEGKLASRLDILFAVLFAVSGALFAAMCFGVGAAGPHWALTLAGGVAYGWFYLRLLWHISTLGLRPAIAAVCLSCTLWVLTQLAVEACDAALRRALLVAIPVVCSAVLVTLRHRRFDCLDARDLRFTGHDLLHMPEVWTVIVAVAFVTSLSVPIVQSLGEQGAAAIVARVLAVSVFAALVAWTRRTSSELRFSSAWRVVCVALCAAFAALGIERFRAVSEALLFATWDVTVAMVWLTLADIARHADVARTGVLGLAGGCYLVASALGGSLSTMVSATLDTGETAVALLFLVALLIALCLTRPSLLGSRVFEDLRVIPPAVENNVLHSHCVRLAAETGLTERERQVVEMIALGKSRSYIAEALVISENTVKSHAAHAYAKLGVHGKKELYALVSEGRDVES